MGSYFCGHGDPSPYHAIQIWEVNQDRLALMQRKVSEAPGILSKSAGRSSCCIFKVPKSINDHNAEHYRPCIVSIGPYHHGKPQLAMIEEHKWRLLGSLLKRTEQKNGSRLEDYWRAVQPLEAQARDCYSEAFQFSKDEFTEMLVLDGCFIIELLRKFGRVVRFDEDDPLSPRSWVFPFLLRDLIRLENQIPFFILQCLFDRTLVPGEEYSGSSLRCLTLKVFNNALQRPEEILDKYSRLEGGCKHILDLLWSSFIPPGLEEPKADKSSNTHVIECISHLRRAGIDLKPGKEESFLAIKFRHGVLEMPTIALDDFMSSFLLNCVAYEQCHGSIPKLTTAYVTFLDCLINTAQDVKFLCDRKIIENSFSSEAELARFINKTGKDIWLDFDRCYLSQLFQDVNEYYNNEWHVHWAGFKYTYFKTPWSFVSALAAFLLLVLTFLQTIYTILGYVKAS